MKILLNLFCFCLFTVSIFGQTDSQAMKLFDSVDKPNCEDLLARLDAFTVYLAYSPTPSIGQIVFSPGSDPIANAKYEKYLKIRLISRKLQDKVLVQSTKPREMIRFEFWVGPVGTTKNQEKEPLTRVLPITPHPILFDSDLFEMFVDRGKRAFVGVSCAACCISNLDWHLLSEFLDANRKLIPYVVIRGRPSRHQAIKSHLIREMRDAGFNVGTIKFFFEKKNLVNSNNFSEVAVFVSNKTIRTAKMLRSDLEEQD